MKCFYGGASLNILRIKAEGLPLYSSPFDISFFATQRVQGEHVRNLSHLFGNIYTNTVEAFIGINASGKTTALKVITFSCVLLSGIPLNSGFVPSILAENKPTVFDIDFYHDSKIYHLRSEIIKKMKEDGSPDTEILSEKLWVKQATSKVNKSNLLVFTNANLTSIRDNSNDYLPNDVSIMIAINKKIKDKSILVDLAALTNINLYYPEGGVVPPEIIALLDPTIEKITVESINSKFVAKLKFYGQDEITLYNPSEFNVYLSSGTVKGIRVFSDAIRVLKAGGYLIVDELENHFNRELVASLLRLFMSKQTNPNGSTIIFSTHYPELLDEIDRNDAVFITRNRNGLSIENLNTLISRNDIKKSEIYQSNYLGGTAPKYDALLALQKAIVKRLEV